MRILTNPGSNLSRAQIEQYGIDVTPQEIVVGGTYHDTREGVDMRAVDHWIATAAEHPYVLGTSAAQFATMFTELGASDPEILAVMTSRELIQSYDAAVSAVRTLAKREGKQLDIRVVDTGVTDVGAGLSTLLAVAGRTSGLSLDECADALEKFRDAGSLRLHVATMDNLIKGGRASFLRGWLANVLGLRPILAFRDGRLEVTAKISTRADPVEAVVGPLIDAYRGRPVWAAIAHGGASAEEGAQRAAVMLRRELDPAVLLIRPFSPGVYLHAGPGALTCFVAAVDELGFAPSLPPLQ